MPRRITTTSAYSADSRAGKSGVRLKRWAAPRAAIRAAMLSTGEFADRGSEPAYESGTGFELVAVVIVLVR